MSVAIRETAIVLARFKRLSCQCDFFSGYGTPTNRRMFGKIASMVHQAAEAVSITIGLSCCRLKRDLSFLTSSSPQLAPSMSSKDEFVQCWKAVTTQLIEIRGSGVRVACWCFCVTWSGGC